MKEGGLDGGFWVIFTPQGPLDEASYHSASNSALLRQMAIREMAAKYADEVELAFTAEVLADVDAITAVDAKVYRAAVLRLLCDIRALEEAAGARVLCPARLAKLRAATSYIPRLWGRGANASARYD